MNDELLCSDCGATHSEPLDARLGHVVPCADCTLRVQIEEAASVAPLSVAA